MNYHTERLQKQMAFLLEVDKMKNIIRQTYLSDGSRKENDAEHSWHLALMAIILSEYFDKDIDLLKVVKMLLIHDIVEIDAGDTFCHDQKANEDKKEREEKAAKRIYQILPDDQAQEYKSLWHEFENVSTKESVFANILDRLQPSILNLSSNGKSWLEHEVSKKQVLERNEMVFSGPEEIAEYMKMLLDTAVKSGYLK